MSSSIAVRTAAPRNKLTDERVKAMWLHQYQSPATRSGYGFAAEAFFEFIAPGSLANLDIEAVQAWVDSLTGKPATRAARIAAVKSLLAFSADLDYIRSSFARFLKRPKYKADLAERILSEDEVLSIINAAPPLSRDSGILRFLYATGARVAELTGLTWRDIKVRPDGSLQATLFGKGGKTRAVILSNPTTCSTVLSLRHGREDCVAVFQSRNHNGSRGETLDRVSVHRMVKKYATMAGITAAVSPHWFRHAHASHALGHGATLVEVRDTLGHTDISTTGRYLHCNPDSSSGRVLCV